MFKLSELVQWLGMTEFEIFTNLVALQVFTILLAMRISGYLTEQTIDWFGVFSPLFCGDVCNAYFCVIVAIRTYINHDNHHKAIRRFLWSAMFLSMVCVFKYMLCLKLSGDQNLDYSEVFAPIFVLLQVIALRTCKMTTTT